MMKLLKIAVLLLLVAGMSLLLLYLNRGSVMQKGKISVERVIKAPFIDDATQSDTVLLFFGYVGCAEVCTPFLEEMHGFYRNGISDALRGKVDVVFVNLLSEIDPVQADEFAKAFDGEFKGVYLNGHELRRIAREFGLLFSPSLFDKNKINHTDYLYLLERSAPGEWLLKNFYLIHPLKKVLLLEDMQHLVKEKK